MDWTYEGRNIRLVDTAGMRRKARVQEKLEKLSVADTIRAITFAEVVVLVMDRDNAFDTQDLQLADLVEREGRALIYVIAKWDLEEEPQSRMASLKETADRMLPQLKGAPFVALSAHNGRGVERLMPAVLKAHDTWSVKVKTRDLNDWLAMAVQRHPPPAVDGRRIKPKYIAQTKARPPTFVMFASRATQMPEQYKRYLINSLRESFDLPGTPMRLTVKSGAQSVRGRLRRTDAAQGGRQDRAAPRDQGPEGRGGEGVRQGPARQCAGEEGRPAQADGGQGQAARRVQGQGRHHPRQARARRRPSGVPLGPHPHRRAVEAEAVRRVATGQGGGHAAKSLSSRRRGTCRLSSSLSPHCLCCSPLTGRPSVSARRPRNDSSSRLRRGRPCPRA